MTVRGYTGEGTSEAGQPSSSRSSSRPSGRSSSESESDCKEALLGYLCCQRDTNDNLDVLDTALQNIVPVSSELQPTGERVRVIARFTDAVRFTTSKAEEMRFVDGAVSEVEKAIAALKSGWSKEFRALYSDTEFLKLQDELKAMQTDRKSHEDAIRMRLDHSSQGASRNGDAKLDKVKLTLASNLEKAKSGYRQIQLIDLYCLSRGNEMWAIIPFIQRVGHDIDPIQCRHWKPTDDDVPDAL